ncbi:HD domain-containing protein [Sinomicrobium weinanense]|uniref:HD domain-containing protein n=1 Tax=Sinomicrobium weinanense TaxID=2842200 RepID=A0A926Q2Z3_9FLAO|nr:HD domain-containing protein [Sinomicrobium weinanense]MBC9795461.1 HD domain-containing protein [Sinomicrobium weinanense]MBU3123986.1 HD domain-containing protein [Sinomicrobium weinanense]
MNNPDIIPNTIAFVKQQLKDAEGGHDWFHILRVYNNTMLIARSEKADMLVVQLGALLHDIADSKFHNGDESVGPKMARTFLENENADRETIDHVVKIIENISFKGSYGKLAFRSRELDIVQDADRLDAIGAIGIARAFNYGGFKNRELHNPDIPPQQYKTKAAYKNNKAPTINHFYEKLLLLKDRMNTETGRKIAEERHRFMEDFLEQFYGEWEGTR